MSWIDLYLWILYCLEYFIMWIFSTVNFLFVGRMKEALYLYSLVAGQEEVRCSEVAFKLYFAAV